MTRILSTVGESGNINRLLNQKFHFLVSHFLIQTNQIKTWINADRDGDHRFISRFNLQSLKSKRPRYLNSSTRGSSPPLSSQGPWQLQCTPKVMVWRRQQKHTVSRKQRRHPDVVTPNTFLSAATPWDPVHEPPGDEGHTHTHTHTRRSPSHTGSKSDFLLTIQHNSCLDLYKEKSAKIWALWG